MLCGNFLGLLCEHDAESCLLFPTKIAWQNGCIFPYPIALPCNLKDLVPLDHELRDEALSDLWNEA
jgi:hypothetical protein